MRRWLVRFREFMLYVALVVAGVGAILALGRDGWKGWTPNGGLAVSRFFCEALREGTVRQPVNTWSNAGFLAVALALGYRIGREDERGASGRSIDTFHGVLVIFLGVGSMFMHASWTHWGGIVDVVSMLAYATFLVARPLSGRRGAAAFASIYVLLTAPVLAFYLWIQKHSTLLFGGLLGAFVLLELSRADGDRRWLLSAGACFLSGLAAWLGSQNGGPLCCPTCLIQGHAIWHLLCAAATWCLFRHFRP